MIAGPNVWAASGYSGRANRMNPYAPSFSMTAARMTLPAVGASVCASGSQVWNGNIGTLIANARKNARNAAIWSPSAKPLVWAYSRSELEVEGADPRAVVPALVGEGRGQDRDQHQERPDERVQDELDRGVDPVGAAPDADDQVHRDQDDLPEDVEQEHVQGDEHADHPDLEDEERDHVFLDPGLDRLEARQDRDPRQGGRQDHERHGQAVRTDDVADPEVRDPRHGFDELEARHVRQVADEQHQRDDPGREREGEGRAASCGGRQDRDDDRADQRQERHERQDREGADVDHRWTSTRYEPAMTSSPTAMPRA